MIIFPKECDQGVCGSHYLFNLVHYEPIHRKLLSLHLVQAALSHVSKLPTVRLPTELSNWTGIVLKNLCPSAPLNDGSVVAFCNTNEEQYHIWEPESGRVVSLCFPPNLHFQFWLAVGKLYSIVAGRSEGRDRDVFAVIGTYTGVMLLKDISDCHMYIHVYFTC